MWTTDKWFGFKRDVLSPNIQEETEDDLTEAHIWYDTKGWHPQLDDRYIPLNKAKKQGADIIYATKKHNLPDSYIGIPIEHKDLISYMDKHAQLADPDSIRAKDKQTSPKVIDKVPAQNTVKFGHYTLTTHKMMKGANEGGDIHRAFTMPNTMKELGIPVHKDNDYGDTVRINVKNNETGQSSNHHVYQRSMDPRTGERSVSIRSIGDKLPYHAKHSNIISKYLEGKPEPKLDEEVVHDKIISAMVYEALANKKSK